MLVTKLAETLNSFYLQSDSNKRSIIIDGKWGCGKTYNINCFLKGDAVLGRPKPNAVYISLFGISSATEIVLKLAAILDTKYINNINGNYSIVSSPFEKSYNNCIVVFDDLERKEDSLTFDAVFGIVDSLRKLGFKIVCVVNSRELAKQLEYLRFVEKSFDSIIHVSPDPYAVQEVIPDFGFEVADYLSCADGNWRILKKAANEYREINAFMEKKEKADFLSKINSDPTSFFRCVLLAVKCVFSKNDKKPLFSDGEKIEESVYKEEVDVYGFNVANELYRLFSSEGGENWTLKSRVLILIKCIVENDYQDFLDQCYPSHNNGILSKKPFCFELYYLDDKGKKEYKDALISHLGEFDFHEEKIKEFLVYNIGTLADLFTKNEAELLADRIVETVPLEEGNDYANALRAFRDQTTKELVLFIDLLKKKFASKREAVNKYSLELAFSRKDYDYLTDFLYKNKHKELLEKERIANVFASYGYCLPDLSEKIDSSIWEYCHEIARFISEMKNHREQFISALDQQCKKSKSRSLRRRCYALVKNNFHEDKDFSK